EERRFHQAKHLRSDFRDRTAAASLARRISVRRGAYGAARIGLREEAASPKSTLPMSHSIAHSGTDASRGRFSSFSAMTTLLTSIGPAVQICGSYHPTPPSVSLEQYS